MATWFQVLAVGNQQVAIRLPRINEFSLSASLSAIKSFFFPSTKVVTRVSRVDGYAGHLNPVVTDPIDNYENPKSGLT
jgi:hypothetical protein